MTDGCYFRVAYGALQKATVAEGIGRLVNGLRRSSSGVFKYAVTQYPDPIPI